jgi:hypothetical protein
MIERCTAFIPRRVPRSISTVILNKGIDNDVYLE